MNRARRQLVLGLAGGLCGSPFLARAQKPRRDYRVAIVLTTSPLANMMGPKPGHPPTRAILDELRRLGYVEGSNLRFERRSAEGDPARYAGIIDELVRMKCDAIILSASRELIRAAHAATRSIPLVLMGYSAAVEDGFVNSLAKPGGNITGRAGYPSLEVTAKTVQLLKQAVPAMTRIAFLAPADAPGKVRSIAFKAASELGLEMVQIEHHPTDPRVSFAAIANARVDGLLVLGSSISYAQRERLGSMALEARIPAMFGFAQIVHAGGLMSYSINVIKDIRRVAHYVDQILRGANPGDLPMENAREFELTINAKTARALGLTIPQSILLRADRVIE